MRALMQQHTLRSALGLPLALGAALLASSCSASPANVAGTWSINLTNGTNGCMLDNWTPGESTSGIPVTFTQSGSAVTLTVMGGYATALDIYFGSHVFTGMVDGNRIDARLVGRAGGTGGCAYTPVIDLTGTVAGDTVTGQLLWSFDTNTSPDCGMYATCQTDQSMNGSRPPSGM